MASKELLKAMNEHYNFELESGYAYMGMACYFANEGWNGFEHFMHEQYKEEYEHAMKFFEFLKDVGHPISQMKLPEPKNDYPSVLAVFEEALKHEKEVTKRIHKLYEKALDEKAYEVVEFLNWFVKEQVEEETTMQEIIDVLKGIDGAYTGLYLYNKELSNR